MTPNITAVLVYEESETLAVLEGALKLQCVRTLRANSRAEAKALLAGLSPAPLVFTDVQLRDGNWTDILELAQNAAQPVNVIVVDRIADTRFYVDVIESGAFDFLAPPFNATDLAYVLRTAMENVTARRSDCVAPMVRPLCAPIRKAAVQSAAN
jgi:DNA-binding NtrC family response regulator